MDVLEGLNLEQRLAVQHGDGPLLVVAGAGTGKTQVITRRIAHLIRREKAKPSEVLALTFTEKAAREMEERLYDLIGWQSFQVPVMTFHAFGTELLTRFASHIGRSIRGGLLNDTQKTLLLKQHIGDVRLGYYTFQSDMYEFLEGIVTYIGELQNAGIAALDYRHYVDALVAGQDGIGVWDKEEQIDLARLYQLYETVKEQTGTYDYNDQLQLPLQILQSRPNLAERLAREYRYVLVDEYQDTNRVQDELLRMFIGRDGNLFAVGDDDQAIYGFRGADIGNILGFAEHFQIADPVVLTQNYRSGQRILDAAYRLIQHNDPDRLESKLQLNKRLIAQHDDCVAGYRPYRTPSDEVSSVVAQIEAELARGVPAATMAVLASAHAPLRAMAKAMRTRNVPFALSTVANIFEQPELINLWYLLRWLGWQGSDEAVQHVLMGPFFGWKPHELQPVVERSHELMSSLEESLNALDSDQGAEVLRLLVEWRQWAVELPVSALVYKLVFETGRAEEWRRAGDTTGRMVRVFEDLQRWLDQMQDFESVALDPRLSEYLQTFPKPPVLEVQEPVGDLNGVQLLTVHASKGLEFDSVFVINCTQRSWSGERTPVRKIPEGLRAQAALPPEHEYRRLMYVAATRARKSLLVSSPTQGSGGGKQSPTLFIGEMFGEATLLEPARERSVATNLDDAMRKVQRFYPMRALGDVQYLPFEDTEGWLDLSVTQLGGYEYCPFEFFVQHVLQIRQPIGPQLAFGSVLHVVFEAYYKAHLQGAERVASELHMLLDDRWSDRGYERKVVADQDRELAHRVLNRFLEREPRSGRLVVGSEIPIRFEVSEAKLRLRGKIDAIFETPGGAQLRDFKTGRKQWAQDKLDAATKSNFQLRSYALAYEILNGAKPSAVVLDYVVMGAEGTAELSGTILSNHRAKLGVLAEKIRQREFAPSPSPGHECAAIRFYGTGEQDEIIQEQLRRSQEESL